MHDEGEDEDDDVIGASGEGTSATERNDRLGRKMCVDQIELSLCRSTFDGVVRDEASAVHWIPSAPRPSSSSANGDEGKSISFLHVISTIIY